MNDQINSNFISVVLQSKTAKFSANQFWRNKREIKEPLHNSGGMLLIKPYKYNNHKSLTTAYLTN